MDYSQIAQRLAPALSAYFPDFEGTRDLGRGSAFPTTNILGGLTAGDRFFRADSLLPCVYDGTRWVTQFHYHANFNQNATAITGTASYIIGPIRQDVAPYIDRIAVQYFVNGTNNATNYWTITLRGANSTYGATSTIDAFNTSAIAGSTWTNVDRAPNTTTTPANRALFDIVAAPTLAPGGLIVSATIYYRLIIP